jgi:hypothetical protein
MTVKKTKIVLTRTGKEHSPEVASAALAATCSRMRRKWFLSTVKKMKIQTTKFR